MQHLLLQLVLLFEKLHQCCASIRLASCCYAAAVLPALLLCSTAVHAVALLLLL
jgi:hypothetical protein